MPDRAGSERKYVNDPIRTEDEKGICSRTEKGDSNRETCILLQFHASKGEKDEEKNCST